MKTAEYDIRANATDIVTTAVEGGINYWAEVTNYEWNDAFATVTFVVSDDDSERPFTITTDDVLALARKVRAGFPQANVPDYARLSKDARNILLAILRNDDEDDVDYDADDADAIVQTIVFGRIVYG